jgi:hypothetical protein
MWDQTAATMTMNSPEALTELFNLATTSKDKAQAVHTAELMREVGLKCIGLNGVCSPFICPANTKSKDHVQVPRTINCLGAFRASLPSEVVSSLSTKPTRSIPLHCLTFDESGV